MGHPRSLVTTDQLFADALHAQESLALRSDMVLAWDEGDARPAVRIASAERLARMRTTSSRLVEVVRAMPRVPRPELRSLRQLPVRGNNTQWLTALDHAKEHGLILWCDDRVLRAVARSEGVATFGTLTLLDARVDAGLTTPEEALLTKAELLRNHYVDIPFSADLYHAAALADGWQAGAVSVALSRPSAWADAKATAAFALNAASRAVGALPHEAADWISAAYDGLHRATPIAHRRRNLQAFSLQVLLQPWISSSTLPFAWAGLRAGAEAGSDSDAVLEAALTLYHRALAEELPPPLLPPAP